MTTVAVDVADPNLYADGDPLPLWAELRATAPVHWNDHPEHGGGFWAVMTHAPATRVYKDNAAFSSERGIRLTVDPNAIAAATGRMMIVTDPPRHAKFRKLMHPGFGPRRAARLERAMDEILRPLIDEALNRESVDFVSDVAAVLPAVIISQLMDMAIEEHEQLTELTSKAFGASLGEAGCPVTQGDSTRANLLIFRHYMRLLAKRRAVPGADVVSLLAQGDVDGIPLTDDEIVMNCNGLLLGANETTRLASAGGLLALIQHPDQWALLRTGAVSVDTAVEEILRWTSPAMHMVRVARHDVDLDGVLVRAGERVALWNPSANRDETVFDRPEAFDLSRKPNRHIAFGAGAHFCIGAALARMELQVMLRVLIEKVAGAELTGPVRRMRSNFIWGIERLPVRFIPA